MEIALVAVAFYLGFRLGKARGLNEESAYESGRSSGYVEGYNAARARGE